MALRRWERGGGRPAPTADGPSSHRAPGPPGSQTAPLFFPRRPMRGTNFIARQQGAVLSLPLLACVTAIWLVSIHGLDPERMGNLGLISLLPPAFYVALGILAVSFAVVVHRRETATAILFLHVLLLTLIVRATPVILYGTVRYAWTYKHLAIVDYIQRHGGVDRTIDYLSIYHNWPGFFAIAALLTQAAGLQSAASFANWAPVFFDLLAVPALLLIYRSFTADRRLIWLGIWLFEIGNWVGQDYFSPQALGYTLFLYIVGICLQWFGAHPHLPREADGRGAEAGRWAIIRRALARRSPEREPPEQPATLLQRGALFACVALLAFVVVSSHQLSPFMIISALTSLVVFRQSRTWILPALVTLLTAIWYVWAAEPYVRSHLATILDSLGDLTANVTAHSAAVSLPADQLLVARVAQGLTALVLVLAVLGAVRRLRHGRLDLACILLVLAPIPWLVVTHYGTEILFRVYLFALPFAAFFGAALFYPAAGVATARRTIALTALAGVAMLALFCGSYYGHEKMNFVSPAEVAALQRFERIAPPGSLLVQGSWDAPVPYHNYELYHYLSLQEMSDSVRHAMGRDPVGVIEEQIQAGPRYSNAYLLVTRSQEVDLRDIGLAPAHLLKRVQSGVERSPDFTLVYRNRDAALYLLAPDRASSGTTF